MARRSDTLDYAPHTCPYIDAVIKAVEHAIGALGEAESELKKEESEGAAAALNKVIAAIDILKYDKCYGSGYASSHNIEDTMEKIRGFNSSLRDGLKEKMTEVEELEKEKSSLTTQVEELTSDLSDKEEIIESMKAAEADT